jgi:hypothetical protein
MPGAIVRDGEIFAHVEAVSTGIRAPAEITDKVCHLSLSVCWFGALTWLGPAGLLDPPPRNQIRLTGVKVVVLACFVQFGASVRH